MCLMLVRADDFPLEWLSVPLRLREPHLSLLAPFRRFELPVGIQLVLVGARQNLAVSTPVLGST